MQKNFEDLLTEKSAIDCSIQTVQFKDCTAFQVLCTPH